MKKAFELALYAAQKWKRLFIYLIPTDMPRICGYSLSFSFSCTAHLSFSLSLFVPLSYNPHNEKVSYRNYQILINASATAGAMLQPQIRVTQLCASVCVSVEKPTAS